MLFHNGKLQSLIRFCEGGHYNTLMIKKRGRKNGVFFAYKTRQNLRHSKTTTTHTHTLTQNVSMKGATCLKARSSFQVFFFSYFFPPSPHCSPIVLERYGKRAKILLQKHNKTKRFATLRSPPSCLLHLQECFDLPPILLPTLTLDCGSAW